MNVFCLFYNYGDYECSSSTLLGVFLTQDEAETGLLTILEWTENSHKAAAERQAAYKKVWDTYRNDKGLSEYNKRELEAVTARYKDAVDIYAGYSTSAYDYSIEQVTVGELIKGA